MSHKQLITTLTTHFTAAANSTIAAGQGAYLKHQFTFFGIKTPERAAIEKEVVRTYPITSLTVLNKTVQHLWSLPQREYQHTACALAEKYSSLWQPSFITILEHMIIHKSWWDSVDCIASRLVGRFMRDFPEQHHHLDRWINHDNLWLRRTALIYQLSYKEKTDHKRLFAYCRKRMHEKEFFIRKAIGWVLRQYARTNPSAVRHFIEHHKEALSALSYREASKHLYK